MVKKCPLHRNNYVSFIFEMNDNPKQREKNPQDMQLHKSNPMIQLELGFSGCSEWKF